MEKGFAESDYIFEDTFTLPATQHSFLETHACIALVDGSGRITVWSTTQNPFVVRTQLSNIFKVPVAKVRVIVPYLGGGYGGNGFVGLRLLDLGYYNARYGLGVGTRAADVRAETWDLPRESRPDASAQVTPASVLVASSNATRRSSISSKIRLTAPGSRTISTSESSILCITPCGSASFRKQTGLDSRINIFSLPGQHTPPAPAKNHFFRLRFPADFTDNISTPRWPLFTTLKSPQLLSGEASSGLSYAFGLPDQR